MPRRNLIACLAVGLLSLLTWQNSGGAKPEDEMMELYGTFVDAVEQVQANYVKPVSRRELIESALKGMLAELDEHSAYFNDTAFEQFQRRIAGEFTGIGVRMEIDRKSGRPLVVAPLVNSPAYAAGILAGDLILEIEGKSTEGFTLEDLTASLNGRPNTDVTLVVQHRGTEEPQTLTIRRKVIELDSVMGDRRKPDDDSWDFMIDKDRKIGYVRVGNFGPETAADLKKALEELEEQEMKGLILDLRDDPGGFLQAAVEVSDLFLEEGPIVTTRGRNTAEKVYSASRSGTFTGFPMAVLVNQHSASASEIVAASLQDHGRAVVVGQRSFGKGSVQSLIQLDDGAARLKLTVATYWRPSGKNIHRFKDAKPADDWGVSPDEGMEVKLNDRGYVSWAMVRQQRDLLSRANPAKDEDAADPTANDPQLARALEVIEKLMEGEGAEEAGKVDDDEKTPIDAEKADDQERQEGDGPGEGR